MPIDTNDFKCFFCNQRSGVQLRHQNALSDNYRVECSHCEQYEITEEGADHIRSLPLLDRTKVGAYNYHYRINPAYKGTILTYLRAGLPGSASNTRVLSEIIRVWWPHNIREKLDLLLLNLGYFTEEKPSKIAGFCTEDFPKLFGSDWQEGYFYLQRLEEAGFITILNPLDGAPRNVQLTLKGFDKLDELKSGRKNSDSNQVFIAMSFDSTLDSVFESGIAPAVEGCGYEVLRIDRVEHNQKICEKIEAAIRSSRFIVADFTLNRAGVYYEAGLARGLGLQVVWTVRNEQKDIESLHFDTRQYNHLRWDNPQDLQDKLRIRIKALGL